MPYAEPPTPPIKYPTPFKQHLSFFDLNTDGTVHWNESLRASLSLGLDFPAALVFSAGMQILYGNTSSFLWGPFNGIDILKVPVHQERNMLEGVNAERVAMNGISRGEVSRLAFGGAGKKGDARRDLNGAGVLERMHVFGLWALAADSKTGLMRPADVRFAQKGTLLWELRERRRDRWDVLPLSRGGPISVAGHSWFVGRMFGVGVYEDVDERGKGR